jgi:hypothetical protein
MILPPIYAVEKSGTERFTSSNVQIEGTLLDFWRWSISNLLSNATRGMLAEYIVAMDLGVDKGVRNEWDPYDLIDQYGNKIEIKTSAYIQCWYQKDYSKIGFDIRCTRKWNAETGCYEGEICRQSDFYVFCLLHHKDQATINPLNLDQWTFYILPTTTIDKYHYNQKSISLNKLLKLNPVVCGFGEVREGIKSFC